MKHDTVMQTGDKAKYKHVFYAVWREAKRAFSVVMLQDWRIARLQEYEDVYSIALASRPMKLSRQSTG